MQDRVPLYPGRVKMTPVAGQANTYDMTRADQPTQEGTPINKAALLKDETAAMFGLGSDAVPDDAFRVLSSKASRDIAHFRYLEFLTSGNWKAPNNILNNKIHVLCCGGGGGGRGGGGGGGHISEGDIIVTPNQVYPIVIGAGGKGTNVGDSEDDYPNADNGGASSAFNIIANGGSGGKYNDGGDGGTGGGADGGGNGGNATYGGGGGGVIAGNGGTYGGGGGGDTGGNGGTYGGNGGGTHVAGSDGTLGVGFPTFFPFDFQQSGGFGGPTGESSGAAGGGGGGYGGNGGGGHDSSSWQPDPVHKGVRGGGGGGGYSSSKSLLRGNDGGSGVVAIWYYVTEEESE